MRLRAQLPEAAWRYGPLAAVAGAVLVLSLAPAWLFRGAEEALPRWPGLDKLVHAAMYAALTAAGLHALPPQRRRPRALLAVALAAALYGAALEFAQSLLTQTRCRDARDGLANAAGALACATVCYAASAARRRRSA